MLKRITNLFQNTTNLSVKNYRILLKNTNNCRKLQNIKNFRVVSNRKPKCWLTKNYQELLFLIDREHYYLNNVMCFIRGKKALQTV